MYWDNYIKLLSAMFGALGAGLVVFSTLSPENLFLLAQSYNDYNPHLIDALAHEKANKITGFNFVTIAFIFTAFSLFVRRNWRPSRLAFVLLAVCSGALVVVVVYWGEDIYQSNKLVMEKLGQEYLKPNAGQIF